MEVERTPLHLENLLRTIKFGTSSEVKKVISEDRSGTLLTSEDGSGRTALHFVAYWGRTDLLDFLNTPGIRSRIEVDHQDFDGNTALVLAAKQKNFSCLQSLVEKWDADLMKKLKGEVTVIHHAACVPDNIQILHFLTNAWISRSSDASQPLEVKHEETDQKSEDVQPIDTFFGNEGLPFASFCKPIEGGSPLHWACHNQDLNNVAFCLDELHIPVDVTDMHGGTALFVASSLGHHEITRFLLERQANLRVQTLDGTTPCSLLLEQETLDVEMVKLLRIFDHSNILEEILANSKSKLPEPVYQDLCKVPPDESACKERASRFKLQGSNAFAAREYVKASKFYTLSIAHVSSDPTIFSNRSACYYNLRQFRRALADGIHSVRLSPTWVKGYYRTAAVLLELEAYDRCLNVCKLGIEIDRDNSATAEQLRSIITQLSRRKKKLTTV